MTDDLVKRLLAANAYKAPDFSIPFVEPIKAEAADRIEALERERDEANEVIEKQSALLCDAYGADLDWDEVLKQRADHECKARLAKAVEALRFYAEGKWPEDYPGGVLHDVDGVTHIDYGHKATAMLAEIEGGKKDD
jgi:hypothetical protein